MNKMKEAIRNANTVIAQTDRLIEIYDATQEGIRQGYRPKRAWLDIQDIYQQRGVDLDGPFVYRKDYVATPEDIKFHEHEADYIRKRQEDVWSSYRDLIELPSDLPMEHYEPSKKPGILDTIMSEAVSIAFPTLAAVSMIYTNPEVAGKVRSYVMNEAFNKTAAKHATESRLAKYGKIAAAGGAAAAVVLTALGGAVSANHEIKNLSNDGNHDQGNTHVSGKNIIWYEGGLGTIYDAETEERQIIPVFPNSEDVRDFGGDKVILPGPYDNPNEIHVYNITSGNLFRIIGSTESNYISGSGQHMAIDKNLIAYEGGKDWREENRRIFVYDLISNTERRITDVPTTNPSIYGNTVVFEDNYLYDNKSDIFGFDLSTNTRFPIATGPSTQWTPYISGNKVVYLDNRNSSDLKDKTFSDIYVFDLLTKQEIKVTDGGVVYTNLTSFKPVKIFKDLVFWINKADPISHNIHLWSYNITSGSKEIMTPDYLDVRYFDIDDYRVAFSADIEVSPPRWFDSEVFYIDLLDRPIIKNDPPIISDISPTLDKDILSILASAEDPDSKIKSANYKILDNGNVLKSGTLNAEDGAFDEQLESIKGEVNVSDLGKGKTYDLEVRAFDEEGLEGYSEKQLFIPTTGGNGNNGNNENPNNNFDLGVIVRDYPYVIVGLGALPFGVGGALYFLKRRKKRVVNGRN